MEDDPENTLAVTKEFDPLDKQRLAVVKTNIKSLLRMKFS